MSDFFILGFQHIICHLLKRKMFVLEVHMHMDILMNAVDQWKGSHSNWLILPWNEYSFPWVRCSPALTYHILHPSVAEYCIYLNSRNTMSLHNLWYVFAKCMLYASASHALHLQWRKDLPRWNLRVHTPKQYNEVMSITKRNTSSSCDVHLYSISVPRSIHAEEICLGGISDCRSLPIFLLLYL